MTTITEVKPGDTFGPFDVSLSAEAVDAYTAAVGGGDGVDYGGQAPPAAVVAIGLGKLIDQLGLFEPEVLEAGGVVHTTQEAEFMAPVQPGEEVTATAVLKGNSVRGGSRFVSVQTEFRGAAGVVAMASSTIVAPV